MELSIGKEEIFSGRVLKLEKHTVTLQELFFQSESSEGLLRI